MTLIEQRRRQSRRVAFRWISGLTRRKSEVLRHVCLGLVLLAACGGGGAKPAPTLKNSEDGATRETPMGRAKQIVKDNDGGVIELIGERNTALERANIEMAKHCGSEQYTIFQEGEESVDTNPCAIRPETAWRVHYSCNKPN